jgi:hypothetical protein
MHHTLPLRGSPTLPTPASSKTHTCTLARRNTAQEIELAWPKLPFPSFRPSNQGPTCPLGRRAMALHHEMQPSTFELRTQAHDAQLTLFSKTVKFVHHLLQRLWCLCGLQGPASWALEKESKCRTTTERRALPLPLGEITAYGAPVKAVGKRAPSVAVRASR